MPSTENLGLPFLEAGQAQKHVTLNEALRMLDALVQLSVVEFAAAPPDTPENGARYLVAELASGGFAGKDHQVAVFEDGAWRFLLPQRGWLLFVASENELRVFDEDEWKPLQFSSLQELSLLGIGTSADDTNPFAAKLNKALWTARYDGEGGDGSLRYTLNKEAPGKVLSLLLQSNWSGRAEIGLTGDDDFRFKVSDDGATWRDGIVIAHATGKVSFPHGTPGLREKLQSPRTYYVRTDGNDTNDGLSSDTGGAWATLQHAADIVFGMLDLGGHDVTIQVADGTYSAGIHVVGAQAGAGNIIFQGNATEPANVVVNSSVAPRGTFTAEAGAFFHLRDLEVRSASHGLLATRGGKIYFQNIRCGPVGAHQIRADDQGLIAASGNYTVAGNGATHWDALGGGIIRVQFRTITLEGTPSFAVAFATPRIGGQVIGDTNTFVGSAAGPRYNVTANGIMYAAGAGETYLPGNSAGATSTGGQYV